MKKIKILIDILMYFDFLYLMNHGVIHNLTNHGVLGIILFALFIVHHLLNLWFYKIALKGRWNAKRIVLNVTDWVLFLLMILMAVSSIGMSGLVFEWSPVQTTQGWRILHLVSCSWGFMIMSLHLGLHTISPLKKLENKIKPKFLIIIFYIILIILGIFSFIKTQLYVFMFNTVGWKMAAPNVVVGFLEYIGITAGICFLIMAEKKLLKYLNNEKNE